MMQDQADTSLSAAFRKAGYVKEDMEFHAAVERDLKRYYAAGGVENKAYDLFDLVIQKLRGEKGQLDGAAKAVIPTPVASQPSRTGTGHADNVRKGQVPIAGSGAPSAAQIQAHKQESASLAKSVYERRTFYGAKWGDIGAHELPAMERHGKAVTAILTALGKLVEKDRFKPLKELLSEKRLAKLLDNNEE